MYYKYNNPSLYWTNCLQHHGILGMKWGVRRFQNKDGTLTNIGKKHRSRLERAADAQKRDADDLRKHGYIDEANAVQKVADKTREKANRQKIRRDKIKNSFEKTKNRVKNSSVKERAIAAGATLGAISIAQSVKNVKIGRAFAEEIGTTIPMSTIIGKSAFAAGKWATIAALSVVGGHMVKDYMVDKDK